MSKPLVVSFSGGKTSAFMSWWIKQNITDRPLHFLFANTGQEHEETLKFVDRCDKAWGLGVVWIEAKVNMQRQSGTKWQIVDFQSASRNGEPFESVIQKYGIPNHSYPHCTRELKLQPMYAWMREHLDEYEVAVGIRADEIDRMQADAKEKGVIYPLISCIPTDKRAIDRFWDTQDFKLEIPAILGNCTWCWKKTLRKHLTLIKNEAEYYEFPQRMEAQYADAGSGTGGRVFFRGHMSTQDLIERAQQPFTQWTEEYQPDLFNEWDQPNGCVESCEVEF